MVKVTEEEKKLAAEMTKLREQNDHNKMLHDRTIGGPNALRPTPEYIAKCTGPIKSDDQIRKEAEEKVRAQQKQEEQERENRARVEESFREHNKRVAEQQAAEKQAEAQRNADLFRQAAAKQKDQGREI